VTTRELRRYSMRPEMFDEFLEWYLAGVPAIRGRFGFTVEWVVVDREHLQIDWLVSHPGTEAEFRAAERAFESSEEWTSYLARVRPSLTELRASFVDVISP